MLYFDWFREWYSELATFDTVSLNICKCTNQQHTSIHDAKSEQNKIECI